MTKRKKTNHSGSIWLTVIGLVCLVLLIAVLLRGKDVALLHPKGIIAHQQMKLMISISLLLLEIGIPTLILFFFVAWKYRETNDKAEYKPDVDHGKFFVFSLWAFPGITVVLMAILLIPANFKLDPRKAIASGVEPVNIEVVALRWKWLFIYPEQHIATVNYVQLPVGVPVQFDLTADDTPMSSFWIPHLGGQLYAMTGHVNRLNLRADVAGDFPGSSAELNGAGFAGMQFTARAGSEADFDAWVQSVKQSPDTLDASTYNDLLTPSEKNPAAFYSSVDPAIYGNILTKYAGSHSHNTEQK